MLKKILDRTAFATTTEESRYTLQGVFLKTENGKLHAAATDKSRLAVVKYPIPFSEQVSGTIPAKAVSVLRKVLDDDEPVAVTIAEQGAKFEQSETVILTRLMLGLFPNYEMIIPKNGQHSVTISDELTRALRRGAITADRISVTRAHKVVFNVSRDSIEVKTSDSDRGEGTELIEAKCETLNGEAIPIGFASTYLSDLLAVEPEVEMIFSDGTNPFMLRPTGAREYEYQYVIAPCRI